MKKGLLPFLLGILGLILTFYFCLRPSAPPIAAVPAPAPVAVVPAAPPAAQLAAEFADGKVSVLGVVSDEAMRGKVLDQARASYGAGNVIDKLRIDSKVAPVTWLGTAAALAPFIVKSIARGRSEFDGKTLVLTGEVASDAVKQQTGEAAKKQLGSDGSVDNRLTIATIPAQKRKLDELLAGKTIEFAVSSAVITPAGMKLLDQLVPVLQEDKTTKVEVAGHTDNQGDDGFNMRLSDARATATLNYLVGKGITATRLSSKGYGSSKPIADNATPEGQQKNRRIDFYVQEGK